MTSHLSMKPLPTLPHLWDSISLDFIEQLPPSLGFTTILIVVDHSSKQGIFIPTVATIDLEQLAPLFIMHVYLKHGVPNHVTSDYSTEFMSHFTHSLSKVLDMYLHFTSGYHTRQWTD